MRYLILLLWPLAEIDILTGGWLPGRIGAVLLGVYILFGIGASHAGNIALALGITTAAVLIAMLDTEPARLMDALAASLVFAAFVPSAQLLRTVAETDPNVMKFRARLAEAGPAVRPGWLLTGANVLGSVLTIGAMAVLSPVFADRSDPAQRRKDAVSTLAGTALAVAWSPFFVAMAVISSFLPSVPLWLAMALGLSLTLLGLAIAMAVIGVPGALGTAWQALKALGGFVPMIVVAGTCVVLLRVIWSLSTLEAGCLAIPPLSVLLIALRSRSIPGMARRISDLFGATFKRIGHIGPEVSIVALAFALSVVLRSSPTVSGLIAAAGLSQIPAWLVIPLIPATMMAAGLLSVHPIVSASLLLAVFSDHHPGLSDLSLMGATLVGWSAAAMVSVSGLLLMVTTSFSDVPRNQLIFGRNAIFAPAYALITSLFLILVNFLMV